MNKQTSSLAAETEMLRETYAAYNRNDIETAVKPFDEQIAWIEPSEYPGGGTYRGFATVKAHLSKSRET
jgi:ketosteroid isomerase-like protein